jgi:hypothetical protein
MKHWQNRLFKQVRQLGQLGRFEQSGRRLFLSVTSLLVFMFSITGYGLSTKQYKLTDPLAWTKQPKMFGADVVYFSNFVSSEQTPVFLIMTLPNKIGKQSVLTFLENNIRSQYADGLVVVAKGTWSNLKMPAYYVKYKSTKNNMQWQNLSIIIPNQISYHLLDFSAPSDNYDHYFKTVEAAINSFTIIK